VNILEQIGSFLVQLWSFPQTQITIYHVLINVVVALAAAIRAKDLDINRIGEFLYRKLLPFIMVYAVVVPFSEQTGLSWLVTSAWAVIELTLLTDLLDNLKVLGVPIPDAVMQLIKRDEVIFIAEEE
jgi:phage-related holin